MVRILITGASGMLGGALAPHLAQGSDEVLRHGYSVPAEVNQDLTDLEGTRTMLDHVNPEIIVNLVALTDVDQCEENLQRGYLLNVRTVENLSAWIADNDNAYLIHITTDQVYDGPGPHKENDITLTNIYALTKYASELAAIRVPSTVLRTNFFGRSVLPDRKSLSDWLFHCLKHREPIKVFSDVLFSPLSIPTLTAMIGRVVARPRAGIFNLGSRNGLSKADFAFAFAEVFGLDADIMTRCESSESALKAYRPKDMRMDCTRFEASFGIALPSLLDEIQAVRKQYDA